MSFNLDNGPAIDRNGIRKVMVAHENDISECYMHSGTKETGKMVFDFEIDDRGKLLYSKMNTDKSSFQHKALGACVSIKMMEWQFPPSNSTMTTQIFWPIVFKSSPTGKHADAR
jgi:hypothetical protein